MVTVRRAIAGALLAACGLAVAGCLLPRSDSKRDPDGAPATQGKTEPASRGKTEPASQGTTQPATQGETEPPAPTPDEEGVHRVDPRFAPVEAIVERVPLPGLSNTTATTIGTKVYVADLARWLQRHPPGSALYDGVLLHEQVHATRQLAAGVDPWIQRYLSDRAFMWDEEQRGWYVELRHLRERGQGVDVQAVARNLSRYRNLTGAMVTYDEALAWAQAVLDGRWTPPP